METTREMKKNRLILRLRRLSEQQDNLAQNIEALKTEILALTREDLTDNQNEKESQMMHLIMAHEKSTRISTPETFCF